MVIDTLLVGGDHKTDSRGLPVAITGVRELMQRALIRLAVKKGSFKPDPALGSELWKLKSARGDWERLARSYAQEALLPLPELAFKDVKLERPAADILRLYVELSHAQNNYQLEVDIT